MISLRGPPIPGVSARGYLSPVAVPIFPGPDLNEMPKSHSEASGMSDVKRFNLHGPRSMAFLLPAFRGLLGWASDRKQDFCASYRILPSPIRFPVLRFAHGKQSPAQKMSTEIPTPLPKSRADDNTVNPRGAGQGQDLKAEAWDTGGPFWRVRLQLLEAASMSSRHRLDAKADFFGCLFF